MINNIILKIFDSIFSFFNKKEDIKVIPITPKKEVIINDNITKEKVNMKMSERGKELLVQFEGLKLEPYLDSVNIPTIGIGCTFYEDGTKVTMDDPSITKERAFELMNNVLQKFEDCVNGSCTIVITQNQFDSMTSLCYNIGPLNFKKSTLLKLLNQGDFLGASKEFEKWNKASGKVLEGLTRRRKAEKELFLTS